MISYIIIPGIDGSDEDHWQTRWERRWGAAAVRIAPSSWTAPDLEDWVAAVGTAYAGISPKGHRVALVAHSLGCWAAAIWLNRNPKRAVAGTLLVAPPDPGGPAFPGQAAPTFRHLPAEPLSCPATVVGSGNDPYASAGAAAGLADRWRAGWHLAGDHGHLNSASGLGDWPAGHRLLDALTRPEDAGCPEPGDDGPGPG
ncbi:RBBP9/YdeN family alpha/beta hydrolase [Actinoplanes flavus]|uniref:Serine hydrolase family protein n=1 Tax=Actinoplanes flavus TaxID=2820290 RepID=A0ABS3UEY8_9ACTN|nr:alpha/beta hydrolase [Actinoplanes flavus]MBO3737339.1 serine hydrolase family protein [Actinoplanes flavus]